VNRVRFTAAAALGACLLAANVAQGAGYQVGQESISGAGVAHAGGAAAAADASTVYANPAGMILIEERQFVGGGHLLPPALFGDSIHFINQGSVTSAGAAVTGGDGGDGGVGAFIPNLYAVWPLQNGMRLGVGLNAPYGLATDWEEGWVGRYNELGASVATVNLNPSAAYRVNKHWSVGAGVNVMYSRARLTQAVDFGSALGGTSQSNDGSSAFSGSATAFGFNLGFLYELNANTRFGGQYRSGMNFNYYGDADFSVSATARAGLNGAGQPRAFTDGKMRADLPIPDTASISVYHDVPDSKWAFMADLTWTRWEVFDRLVFIADEPTTTTNVVLTFWDNKFRVSGGATYDYTPKLQLRGGLAFDDSPIKTLYRGAGVPDSDRIIVAAGAGYALRDNLTIDFAYQHYFFKDGTIINRVSTGTRLIGEFETQGDWLSLGVTWKF
jgi:long-chain fatty acid transport protein